MVRRPAVPVTHCGRSPGLETRGGGHLHAILVAASCLLASFVPYAAGYVSSSSDLRFGGLLLTHLDDVHGYLATMHLGARGSPEFHILHTPEQHPGAYLYLFYLALGRIAKALGVSMLTAYHLARLAAAGCLLAAIYWFIATFVSHARTRLHAYILASAGSGFGWLALLFLRGRKECPMDFVLSDLYTFPTMSLFPHGSLAVAIVLAIFVLWHRCRLEARGRCLAGMAGLSILLSIVQPICSVVAIVTGAALCVVLAALARRVPRRDCAALLALGAASLPAGSYYLWLMATNQVVRSWQEQNLTPSPPPAAWLAGLGVILPLAIIGVRWLSRESLLLAVWPLTVSFLLYLPRLPQRRFAQGVLVPLGALAALGMDRLFGQEGRRAEVASHVVLCIAVLSNVSFVALHTRMCLARPEPIFHPRDELEALAWLESNSSPEDTVLAGPRTGAFIPAAVGHRVFWVHWCETINLEEKRRQFDAFFAQETADQWRHRFLTRYNIRYLFYGPQERNWGDFCPSEAGYLRKRFQVGRYAIYQVLPGSDAP